MRFAMVTTFYPPFHFGGDAMYAYRLTNALARRGHEVVVVHSEDAYRALGGPEPTGTFRHEPGVTVVPLSTAWPLGAATATYLGGRPAFYGRQLRRVLDADFDVVHFHNVSLAGGPGVLAYGQGVKLYTTSEHWLVCPMHVLFRDNREPCTEPHCLRCTLAFRRPPQLWRYTDLLERAVPNVDLFLSPSRFTLDAHRERGFTAPMRHLPYFLPETDAAAAEPAARERPYFLFVGRLERLKGVQVLVEAFRSYRGADLLVVGDGEFRAELERLARGLDHVRFLGRVHPSELRPLYAGAIATLVPSIGYEVFGIVLLESFAQRTPAIVHDLGALPEVVTEAKGGLVYRTPAELVVALEQLGQDGATRDELGGNGYETWKRLWTEDPHLDAYLGVVEELRT
jgi:glycosyltransferase involved in cell wall biosynthesis